MNSFFVSSFTPSALHPRYLTPLRSAPVDEYSSKLGEVLSKSVKEEDFAESDDQVREEIEQQSSGLVHLGSKAKSNLITDLPRAPTVN